MDYRSTSSLAQLKASTTREVKTNPPPFPNQPLPNPRFAYPIVNSTGHVVLCQRPTRLWMAQRALQFSPTACPSIHTAECTRDMICFVSRTACYLQNVSAAIKIVCCGQQGRAIHGLIQQYQIRKGLSLSVTPPAYRTIAALKQAGSENRAVLSALQTRSLLSSTCKLAAPYSASLKSLRAPAVGPPALHSSTSWARIPALQEGRPQQPSVYYHHEDGRKIIKK